MEHKLKCTLILDAADIATHNVEIIGNTTSPITNANDEINIQPAIILIELFIKLSHGIQSNRTATHTLHALTTLHAYTQFMRL